MESARYGPGRAAWPLRYSERKQSVERGPSVGPGRPNRTRRKSLPHLQRERSTAGGRQLRPLGSIRAKTAPRPIEREPRTETMRQLFGTDGIRGTAGDYPLDRPTTFAVGVALAQWIGTNHLNPEVVLGMDTRESGPWIAEHVAGGLAQGGVRARNAGLITTPGLAYIAKTGPFAAGIMISAS